MRILDKTFLAEDEGWNLPVSISRQIVSHLRSLRMDSYNNKYVIRLTVDVIDDELPETPDDDEEEEE